MFLLNPRTTSPRRCPQSIPVNWLLSMWRRSSATVSRSCITELSSVYFPLMTSFLCTKSQKQCSQRASYCKVKTAQFQRENHDHQMTHYQQVLGESRKKKLPFNRKKTQAEPGKLIMSLSCSSPASSSLQTMAVGLLLLFRATTLHPP